jgi:hypothetical protein
MAPTTPAEWRDLLDARLHERWNEWKVYDAYYEGDHRISSWLRTTQTAFQGTVLGQLLRDLTDNYMTLVVDAPAERCRVQGFRFGEVDSDDEAWSIWQANGLDTQSNMVHTESIKLGEAYWMVQPSPDGPLITAEHPSQVIVAHAPGDRRKRVAALKKWNDGDDIYANVYLPNVVVKYHTTERAIREKLKDTRWKEIDRSPNPLGEVPIVPIPNNPSMLRGGRSDLSYGALSLQDQITKTVVDLLIGSEYHGLPQRVLLGVEPPRDENGKPIPFQTAAKSRLWYFGNENAKAHEFSQADLEALRKSVDGYIGDLAAQTRIPIYYFRPAAISNISAEALIGLDAGLVSKSGDKQQFFGEGHEETMRLAFKSMDPNDSRAAATDAETIWENTESRSQAQLTDAVTKEVSIGLPFEAALERLGYSPQHIDRILAMRAEETFLTPEATAVPADNVGTTENDPAQR